MAAPDLLVFCQLVVPEDRAKLTARRRAILRGKCPSGTEFSVRRPDGDLRRIVDRVRTPAAAAATSTTAQVETVGYGHGV